MKRLLLIALLVSTTSPALAQSPREQAIMEQSNNFSIGRGTPDPNNPGEMIPYQPPVEPNIPQVKFLVQDPPYSLKDSVDRILYGIKVDIPPEYDMYGYEIRRYMAHIGGPEVFRDDARLVEELKNIRKAKIILDYWRKDTIAKNAEIEKRIATENPDSSVRTSFKFNAGIAGAFMTECQGWIERNEELLQFVHEKRGAFTFNEPNFTFHDANDRQGFAARYMAAKKAHKYITEYSTFGMMVY
jgi:hypothetical protein